MAARPTNRPGMTATTTRPTETARPRVRDFASPAAGFTIEWDVRPVYDFLFSLGDDKDFQYDLLEEDRSWLDAARETLLRDHAEAARITAETTVLVASLAAIHPEATTIDAFIDVVEATPTQAFLETILCDLLRDPDIGPLVEKASTGEPGAMAELRDAMPEHKTGIQLLLGDPVDAQASIVALLRAYAPMFATIEPRIRAFIERDHALRAVDRGALRGSELIEKTTGGIRWLPEVGIRRIILAPTYFSRPYNILLAGPDWRFFAYPVADEALEAEDRLAPPQAVVRLHRALGDETRLRILKLLSDRDLYLTEIAQQLDLSKPTIKHHLAQLRAAGLVTVIEAGTVIYYSLRRDRIEAASVDLARFLRA